MNLLGQSTVPHSFVSNAVPLQGMPPSCVYCLTFLVLEVNPPPQDLLHCSHSCQSFHSQSTTYYYTCVSDTEGVRNNILYLKLQYFEASRQLTWAWLLITSFNFLCISLANFTTISSIIQYFPCPKSSATTTWYITSCPFFPWLKLTIN